MKVVIVEDEVRIREGIVSLLKKFYKNVTDVYEARSGEDGMEIIRRVNPDLVITDIRMNPIDGLQMLDILIQQEKRTFQTIIMSAFTEFEYARQAITLGVSEYLVKPIEMEAFHQAMQRVEVRLEQERKKSGSMEVILSRLITGELVLDDELCRYLKKTYRVAADGRFAMVCMYLGKRYAEESQPVAGVIRSALKQADLSECYLLFLKQEQALLFVFYNEEVMTRLDRYFQYDIIRGLSSANTATNAVGFIIFEGLEKIRESYETVREYLPWSISLGSDVMISYPKIKQVNTAVLVYPIQLEKDSIEALCALDYDRLKAHTGMLFKRLTEQVHAPDAIKKSIIRYLMATLRVVKEINFPAYERIDEALILKTIGAAFTRGELEEVLSGVLESVARDGGKTGGVVVRKARRMVEEFYHQGIRLEDISVALHMTPEHISAQFVKELGVNFSSYIKNFRLQKAKELLLGTDLRLYEIASQVGYNDAKYFSRVFRESEGILPVEYRKQYK